MDEVTIYGRVEPRGDSAFEFLTFDRAHLAAWGGGDQRADRVSGDRVVRVPVPYTPDGELIRCVIGGREVALDPYTVATLAHLGVYGFEWVGGEPWRP